MHTEEHEEERTAGVWPTAEVNRTQGTREQKMPLRIRVVLELRVHTRPHKHTHKGAQAYTEN